MVEARVSPRLEFALELRVNIGPVLELGWGSFGLRRMVPITGGTVRGPGISGRVLPGGADWQFVDRDGLTFVDAHYAIETADAVRIEVTQSGNPAWRTGRPGSHRRGRTRRPQPVLLQNDTTLLPSRWKVRLAQEVDLPRRC